MSPLDFLSILHTAERLKDTPRHCTTTNGRTESVAEHSWRTALMAMLLKNEFPQIDIDKVTAMCIIHATAKPKIRSSANGSKPFRPKYPPDLPTFTPKWSSSRLPKPNSLKPSTNSKP